VSCVPASHGSCWLGLTSEQVSYRPAYSVSPPARHPKTPPHAFSHSNLQHEHPGPRPIAPISPAPARLARNTASPPAIHLLRCHGTQRDSRGRGGRLDTVVRARIGGQRSSVNAPSQISRTRRGGARPSAERSLVVMTAGWEREREPEAEKKYYGAQTDVRGRSA